MSKKIQLPTSFDEYKSCIETAIAFYSGSKINNNRLNESIAKSLNLKNYDQLKPLIKKELQPLDFEITSNYTKINNILINEEVFTEEMADYYFVFLDDYCEELIRWISELDRSNPNYELNKRLMRNDLKMLLCWDDEYVLSSVDTNKFISPTKNTEEFNKECLKILEINESLK